MSLIFVIHTEKGRRIEEILYEHQNPDMIPEEDGFLYRIVTGSLDNNTLYVEKRGKRNNLRKNENCLKKIFIFYVMANLIKALIFLIL